MASTYCDRTSEFRLAEEESRWCQVNLRMLLKDPIQDPNSIVRPRESGWESTNPHRKSRGSLSVAVAKKSSMFNDPIMEIQELTALIKNDITALNSAVLDLQSIQKMDMADGNYSEDRIVHSTVICDDLKSNLMGATKHLQDVLTTRTEVALPQEIVPFVFARDYGLNPDILSTR